MASPQNNYLNQTKCLVGAGEKLEVYNHPEEINRLELPTVRFVSSRTMGVVTGYQHIKLLGPIGEA